MKTSLPRSERGFALVTTLLLLVLVLTLGGTSLFLSTIDLRSSRSFRTGNQALFAAESGLLHALSTINSRGVQDFQQDIAASGQWSRLYGSATKTIPNYAQYSYQVTVAADPTDPVNRGLITATGSAPSQAQRVLRVTLLRSGLGGSPGAVHLAADSINSSQFTGNKFLIDGNDHTLLGAPKPAGPVTPGISTRNDNVTHAVTQSLSNQQKDNVQGLGFSLNPLTPSVMTTGAPSVTDLDQMTANVLSKAGVVTTGTRSINGNNVFGTISNPQITHMTSSDVKLNGNASGVGVLIVDGSLTVNGTLDFIGWVIVRGNTVINPVGNDDATTTVSGNAFINGSLWTGDLEIKVGGSAIIDYSQEALNLIDNVGGGPFGNLARPMSVVSWQEL